MKRVNIGIAALSVALLTGCAEPAPEAAVEATTEASTEESTEEVVVEASSEEFGWPSAYAEYIRT
nr:hypothetical protein [Butyrivibrio sp.]